MLEVLQRPASGTFELLGGSPVGCSPRHLDRVRDVDSGAAERDLASATREEAAFSAALAASLYTAACLPSQLPAQIASVPQISQAASWDCGLACVAMCLQAFSLKAPSLPALQALYPSKSVWTVDLAHLMRSFGLHISYFTLTLGINPSFFLEAYYEHMQADSLRIQRLFEDARENGIAIMQRSVPDSEIQAFLEGACHLVIALVDKNMLEEGMYIWSDGLSRSSDETSLPSYTGHYVVVCGYDKFSDEYIIRDPDPRAASLGIGCISRPLFNTARKAFGTDEDLLFISSRPTDSNS